MKINSECIYKSKPTRDRVISTYKPSSLCNDGKVYIAGGEISGRQSRCIFYYDISLREIKRLPDMPVDKALIIKINDNIGLCGYNGEVFELDNKTWVKINDVQLIGNEHKSVLTETKQYVISNGALCELTPEGLRIVYESSIISPNNYIPSIDKDIIYFKDGKYDLKDNTLVKNSYTGDYIAYEEPFYSEYDPVIDKKNALIVGHDNPLTFIAFATFPDNTWVRDYMSEKPESLSPGIKICLPQNQFYIAEDNEKYHNVYKFDFKSHKFTKVLSIELSEHSYSQNIQYNHNKPLPIWFENDIALAGRGGRYYDNNEFDNSIYKSSDDVFELSLNIENALYDYHNKQSLSIADINNQKLYRVNTDTKDINIYDVPFDIYFTEQFRDYGDVVTITTNRKSQLYDIKKNVFISNLEYDEVSALCSDRYFSYSLFEDGALYLRRESYSKVTNDVIKLPIDIENSSMSNMSLHKAENYLILYIEYLNDWEIHRIVIDE